MQIYEVDGQLCLFVPDSLCGKTYPAHSPPGSQRARTSASFSRRSSESSMAPYQFLDLNPGHGNLLGESYWEMLSPYAGESSTLNTGASPKDAVVSSLSQILQDSPPSRYYLSRTACLGILRRAYERGKALPLQLETALMIQAGLIPIHPTGIVTGDAYHINQRNEGIDLGGVSGALMHTQNMQMQAFVSKPEAVVAAFNAGAGPGAGGIGFTEEGTPTLKASESGTNMVPAVLCLNDQGGSVMDCSEEVSGTLRAQEHEPQPAIFENHGIDARYREMDGVSPTMSARWGTGGNNVPLIGSEEAATYCIVGNVINRQPQNVGNGKGYQPDIAYTLTGMDRHAVFSRQRVDVFKDDDIASTESARQHKDATDLVLQKTVGALPSSDRKRPNSQYVSQDKSVVEEPHLIRRLTPLECERLQGFPDGWTDIPGASDSARYKALGNSVAIPCVEYIMAGIAAAMQNEVQNSLDCGG